MSIAYACRVLSDIARRRRSSWNSSSASAQAPDRAAATGRLRSPAMGIFFIDTAPGHTATLPWRADRHTGQPGPVMPPFRPPQARRHGEVNEGAHGRVRVQAARLAGRHLDAAEALREAVLGSRERVQRVAPVEVADELDSGI